MRRAALALVAAMSLLAFPACGAATATPGARPAGGTSAPAATGPVNDADVMFLQMMIPHHRQGMEMADLARTRAVRGEVRTLATAVETTQGDEVRAMTAWLLGWGRPLTADAHAHEAHGGLHVTSPEEITTLRRMTGVEFERRFLNVMIAHQTNAIEMARTEVGAGLNAQVKSFAHRIDQSRSAQVRQMLGELN
ncbi:DUF305 domain-containing protein [Sphaerisporangium sp. NPDC088356]|uniref:DUF305 domain-containing protein n=1 Tax=Sphaerisporangium sp. NPDC088356 TaxID=3154871 RepID=UPI0034135F8B